jgi:hypothetical protein
MKHVKARHKNVSSGLVEPARRPWLLALLRGLGGY